MGWNVDSEKEFILHSLLVESEKHSHFNFCLLNINSPNVFGDFSCMHFHPFLINTICCNQQAIKFTVLIYLIPGSTI